MPFKFPATLDSLDDVPANFTGLYSEGDDGKFALNDDLKAAIGQGGLLSDAVEKERKRAQAAEKTLKAWKALGETPAEVQAKIDTATADHEKETEDLRKLIDEKGDASSKFDKLKKDMEATHAKALADKDTEADSLRDALNKHLVESAAVSAISEAKGRVKPLLPTITGMLKLVNENGEYVVRVVDRDGDPRGDGKGGYLDIKGLVEQLRADDDYAPLFESSGTSGSGASRRDGGTGGTPPGVKNPWARGSINLTEQMRITKENKPLAAKLQAAATGS